MVGTRTVQTFRLLGGRVDPMIKTPRSYGYVEQFVDRDHADMRIGIAGQPESAMIRGTGDALTKGHEFSEPAPDLPRPSSNV